MEGDWEFRVAATIAEHTIKPNQPENPLDVARQNDFSAMPCRWEALSSRQKPPNFYGFSGTFKNSKPKEENPFVVRMTCAGEVDLRYTGPKRLCVEAGFAMNRCRFPPEIYSRSVDILRKVFPFFSDLTCRGNSRKFILPWAKEITD